MDERVTNALKINWDYIGGKPSPTQLRSGCGSQKIPRNNFELWAAGHVNAVPIESSDPLKDALANLIGKDPVRI